MSEHAPKHHEHFTAPKEAEHEAHHHKAHPEHEPRHEKKELAPVEQLAEAAKEEAVAGKELPIHEKASHEESPLLVTRELKQMSWDRTMVRVRKQLSAPNRVLSKVIHQPAVNAVSEVGAKTVARPSGLLFGGICAFVGSSFFLYFAKHYGFRYNYLMFALFFVGGFFLGLVLELVTWPLRRKKASNS